MQTTIPSSRVKWQAAAAALLLFAVYWLTVSGAFHSIDEQAVFAVSRNLVYHARVDESTLFWGSPFDAQARVGVDGELYSKYGIGHSALVAILVAVARLIPGAGLASTAMLLNALATALTGYFLVLTAARLGYSQRTATILALLFGLCTYAWVYAKTMFSEPLVALGWVILVWSVADRVSDRRALLAGLAMAATIAIRPASILLTPFFAWLLWQRQPAMLTRRLIWFALPIGITGVLLLCFNWWRFGDPLQFGYYETFNGSLLAGIVGFLVSPDRSIFLFAPPLLALFGAFPAFVKRHGALGWRLAAIAVVTILLYAKWPVFWGGPVWGPRYVLPVLPILLLLLLPAVERATAGRGWQRWTLLGLAVAGFIIQLPGVVWNSLPETQTLGQRYPLWTLTPQRAWLDIAWLHGQAQGLLLAAGCIVLAAIALWRPRRGVVTATTLIIIGASVILLRWLGLTQFGYPAAPAYTSALTRVQAAEPMPALLLNPALYQKPLDQLTSFLNAADARTPFYGLYRLPAGEEGPSTQRVDSLLQAYPRLALLTEGVGPGDPASTTELALLQRGYLLGSEWLEDGFRLTSVAAPQPVSVEGQPAARLDGEIVLESWSLAAAPADAPLLLITLRWHAQQPVAADLHTFVQALDAQSGSLLAGWDSVPLGGFAPTTNWQAGQVIEERLALAAPNGAAWPPVRMIAGLYDPASGQRLLTPQGSDFIELTVWSP
ncbi:MAG: hypothetical protein WAZ19_03455 [Anaerolineae bacterium]